MLICGQEFNEETIARISATVAVEPRISRRELSRRVCSWLAWTSANGKPKDMSCRVALLKLNTMGYISLPETDGAQRIARRIPVDCKSVPERRGDTSCALDEMGEIELVPVEIGDKTASRTWNALMDRYHYLGSGPLCGAQMRYVVRSSVHGWIGGLAFSSAAWRLAPRDHWIGWSDQARKTNLSMVICNSRFLLVPKVPNLASRILARVVRQIRDDWNARYAVEPVLIETYVDQERFQGTCYQAANWIRVGSTRGRGRNDRFHTATAPIKDIYVLPLTRYARHILSCADGQTPPGIVNKPAPIEEQREYPRAGTESWAELEFCGVDFGDARLNKRLVSIAEDLYARPQANIPQACQTRARTKAAYRFFDHPDTSMEEILKPHYDNTMSRISSESVALAVQDTTSLNYSSHPAMENIGPIGSSADGCIGLKVHDTMVFNCQGTPLGLLDVQCWARDPETFGKHKRRHRVPIEQKESYKWLKSYQAAAKAQKKCPHTMLVSVGDREADIFELFDMALSDPAGPKLLVRATHDRKLADEQGNIWERVSSQEICGYFNVRVPRRGNKPARDTRLTIRFAQLTLKPPDRKFQKSQLTVWGVLAREMEEYAVGDPIEWMLITTCEVRDFPQAGEKVQWYAGRWGIEVYHRTLKSGCKIEERQLGAAERIEACLAIDMVVAWRVHHLAKLGRETPDVPCTVFFEAHEWKGLLTYWERRPPEPSRQPPSLREAMRLTAQLGGFLGRKCDGEPGTKSLWLGLQRLDDIAGVYQLMAPLIVVPQNTTPPVSSNPGYG